MPDVKPSGLPEVPPDPALFGVPTNDRPKIDLPEPTPEDPDRERVVSEGATHIVIANRFGEFFRGDKISVNDLPEAADMDALMRVKPYPPIRPLNKDEHPKPDEVTKHHKAKSPEKPVVKLTDPPK